MLNEADATGPAVKVAVCAEPPVRVTPAATTVMAELPALVEFTVPVKLLALAPLGCTTVAAVSCTFAAVISTASAATVTSLPNLSYKFTVTV